MPDLTLKSERNRNSGVLKSLSALQQLQSRSDGCYRGVTGLGKAKQKQGSGRLHRLTSIGPRDEHGFERQAPRLDLSYLPVPPTPLKPVPPTPLRPVPPTPLEASATHAIEPSATDSVEPGATHAVEPGATDSVESCATHTR